jgi:PAS domain S-box-containing protein
MRDKIPTPPPTGMNRWRPILMITILAAGAMGIWWAVGRADREMRQELLTQTRMVAQALTLDQIKALTGSGDDLALPVYQKLKAKISRVKQANDKCRFVYLMGRKPDGKIVFFVDSEPAGSKDYSPPGQVFDEASEELRRLFDTQKELVEGPVTDRWGIWVSGLIPIIDPQNGNLVAVLGMDIDAHLWKWDVAGRAALPVGLILALLIGITAVFAATRRVDAAPKLVLRRLFPPLAVLLILLMAGVGALFWQQLRQRLAEDIKRQVSDVSGDFRMVLDQQASGLAAVLQLIAADTGVQQALRGRDADRLLATWRPVFEKLHRQMHLTQFNFFNAKRDCLLRVNNPEKSGGRVESFTALEAERTGKTASGIEIGPLGTITLRVVQPVFAAGLLVGYVELGKDIKDVLSPLPSRSGLQLVVTIRKEHLNRKNWEDGMRLLGREANWDRIPTSVVIYASQDRLPEIFASLGGQDTAGQLFHAKTVRQIFFEGKYWGVSATPLQDASGKEVGDLLVISEITTVKAAYARLLGLVGTAGGLLLLFLLSFVFVLLRRTDQGVLAQQAELRESEEKYRGIIETTNTGYVIVDTEGKVIDANQEYVRLTGYNEIKEILGRSVIEWTAKHDRGKNAAAINQCLQTGLVKHLELDYAGRDGWSIPVEINATAISTSEGVKLLSLVRDISDRKRVEDEKAKLEAQLVQAQKMEAIGTLAGGIAHDFNNILTAIIGNISLAMLDPQMEEQSRENLDQAEKACLHAQNLSRQLLTFSSGGAPIKEVVSVKRLLTESASFACRGSQVKYEFRLPDDLWAVKADPGQISQVFQNLVINAIQAMPTGGMIKIRGENMEVGPGSELPIKVGRYVKISIKDEGIGISAEHLSRIFDPYFTTKQKGSGLGLAISYSIIKNHHGHISVESELGIGTTFNVYLPASDRKIIQPPKEEMELLSGKGKILVMDDEAMVREVLGKILLLLGYEVKFAEDGDKAIEFFNQAEKSGDPFAAVILDLTVAGGMGGKEAMARLLKIDPQVKAIVSSGYSDDPIMADFQKYGFAAVIAKPYKFSDLGRVLNQALTGN